MKCKLPKEVVRFLDDSSRARNVDLEVLNEALVVLIDHLLEEVLQLGVEVGTVVCKQLLGSDSILEELFIPPTMSSVTPLTAVVLWLKILFRSEVHMIWLVLIDLDPSQSRVSVLVFIMFLVFRLYL